MCVACILVGRSHDEKGFSDIFPLGATVVFWNGAGRLYGGYVASRCALTEDENHVRTID